VEVNKDAPRGGHLRSEDPIHCSIRPPCDDRLDAEAVVQRGVRVVPEARVVDVADEELRPAEPSQRFPQRYPEALEAEGAAGEALQEIKANAEAIVRRLAS